MKKVWQISLVTILILTIIFSFWEKIIVAKEDLSVVSLTTPIAYINWFGNSEITASSLLSDTQSPIREIRENSVIVKRTLSDLQVAIDQRHILIQTMLQESEKFKFTPCGKGTLCYLSLQKYGTEIDHINQIISSLSNNNLIRQDGIDGLIDPRISPDGTLAQYQNNRDRLLLHSTLIANRLRGATPYQSSPRAILTMGGPGSGKSTILKMFGICDRDFVNIDADEFKQDFVEYQVAVVAKDRLAASRVHQESSLLAKQTREKAIKTRRHFCLDGTLANKDKAYALINRLKQNSYEVTVIGALIPYKIALERIEKRAEITGRFIPSEFIKQAYQSLAQNAEAIAQEADFAYLYDTDVEYGKPPKLVGLSINGNYNFKNETVLKKLRSPDS